MTNKTPLAVFSSLAAAAAAVVGYLALAPQAPQPAPKVETVQAAPEAETAPAPPAAAAAQAEAQKPSFDTARVSAEGNVVVAGRAAADATVTLLSNGVAMGTAKANAAGEFVITPDKPLPPGAAVLSLAAENNGQTTQAADTVSVTVKAQAPVAAPAPPPQETKAEPPQAKAPAQSVTIDQVGYDSAGKMIFKGRAPAGETVRLSFDNALAGEAKADDQGQWTYQAPDTMAPGPHALRADEIDASGSVVSSIAIPITREAPALAAAAAPDASTGARSITIQPGNNLWRLSRDLYGAGKDYTVIFEANKNQIRNPRLIYPGQVLATPHKTGQ